MIWKRRISNSEIGPCLRLHSSPEWPRKGKHFTKTTSPILGCRLTRNGRKRMRAIDVHVHPSTRGLDAHACSYFRRNLDDVPRTEEKFADLYIKHDVKALLIGWHPSTVKEGNHNSNEYVIDLAAKYPNAFAGILASLDTSAQDLAAVAHYAEELVGNPKVK